MKKSIFKIVGSAMILALVLSFSGCNNSVYEIEGNKEALPTVAQEEVNCDTGTGG